MEKRFSMIRTVDLNCDLGESFGPYVIGADEAVMPMISSANIACGFHAGDPGVMRRTVRLAARHRVSVGAHPGFRDLAGFGRREMKCSPDEIYEDVLYQVGSLAAFCRAEGIVLNHVKPHGALYNLAAADRETARAIAAAAADFDRGLFLYAPPGSELEKAGQALGLGVVGEVFADRAYRTDGRLVSRDRPGAVLETPEAVEAQILEMVLEGKVVAADGQRIPVRAETICVHGDTPGAVDFILRVRGILERAGVEIAARHR